MILKPEKKSGQVRKNMSVLKNALQAHINVAAIANVVMGVHVLRKTLAQLLVR
ncbi:MAG: hypothetical protein IIB41_01660 [Candidatus Marinimicrobia bacterium]|nr:hypothetical protein [Candidatus Neomarinimicrobiota bacterium]